MARCIVYMRDIKNSIYLSIIIALYKKSMLFIHLYYRLIHRYSDSCLPSILRHETIQYILLLVCRSMYVCTGNTILVNDRLTE